MNNYSCPMSNLTGYNDLVINVNSQKTDQSLQMQLVFITVPIILAPLVGLCSWYIRGYYEKNAKSLEQHKDDKKKYMIENVIKQITLFYWPLYLQLIRYKQLVDRYNEFKAGRFSLSSGASNTSKNQIKNFSPPAIAPPHKISTHWAINPQTEQSDHFTIEMIEVSDEIKEVKIIERISENEKSEAETDSQSSLGKDIPTDLSTLADPKNKGMGLKNAIKIINKFNQAINEYEDKIINALKQSQEIYTKYTPIAEPDIIMLKELIRLDEYITYVTTFTNLSEKNSADIILEEKINKAKFPEEVYVLIENKLHYLQSIYNDLVYNHNSHILESHFLPINCPLSEQAYKSRVSIFRMKTE